MNRKKCYNFGFTQWTNIKIVVGTILFLFIACNKITSGDDLTESDIQKIKKLGILDDNEKIIKFYSEYKKNVAGNFFTNKRIASYWKDENNESKDKINSAFYQDIIRIDTITNAGASFSPYINVIRKDSSQFKVCFDGQKAEIRKTFEEVISIWKSNKK
ncbi:hypothetical protein GCM10022389_00180 [Flavobacterium cheonanense]|uniref:Lipoprotein n=1 Tax=Flavobacterium cheonanense TaxID=706183 RepID=A0ABP7V5T9_9FLAO